MKNKISIISINSPDELTGGGHYFRCLIKGYEKISSLVNVIGKNINDDNFKFSDNSIIYVYNKSLLSDLLSRLMFSPSFLLYYWFHIKSIIKDSDIVAFHSSRLGILVLLTRIFYKDKKIVTHFDNVEYLLIKDRLKKSSFSFRYIVNLWDFLLIRSSEYLCVKLSDKCTFITKEDAKYFSCDSFVIPICYDYVDFNVSCNYDSYFLFTGSFDFEPNVDALKYFKTIASRNSNLKFIAAGRNLSKFNSELKNLTFVDSPSVDKMDELFKNANGYISCVNFGSGMKTKIAEAMKYGLNIYATDNSLIGYDDVYSKDYIYNFKNLSDLDEKLKSDVIFDKKEIIKDFNKYYSTSRVANELNKLFQ